MSKSGNNLFFFKGKILVNLIGGSVQNSWHFFHEFILLFSNSCCFFPNFSPWIFSWFRLLQIFWGLTLYDWWLSVNAIELGLEIFMALHQTSVNILYEWFSNPTNVLSYWRHDIQWVKAIANTSGVWPCRKPPVAPGQSLCGGQDGKPPEVMKILQFTELKRAQNPLPWFIFYWIVPTRRKDWETNISPYEVNQTHLFTENG